MSFISALAAIGIEGIAGTIGAGALMGAGIGAGTSALTGQDIGKGALMGGITGGIGGGISGGLQALAPEGLATEAAIIEPSAGNALQAGSGAVADTSAGTSALGSSGFGASPAQLAASNMAPSLSVDTTPALYQGASNAGANLAPNVGANMASNAASTASTAAPAPSTMTEKIGSWAASHPNITTAGASLLASPFVNNMFASDTSKPQGLAAYNGPLSYYKYDPTKYRPSLTPSYATGGITDLDGYQSNSQVVPEQGTLNVPNPLDVADPEGYASNSTMSYAEGGVADLGSYATGGIPNLLRGPGDGVSDSLHATIGGHQPARLAAGEYVVPSRIVSELGNGSTDAGAKRLDDMVKKIQAGRRNTLKGKDFAKDTHAYKHLPV